MAFMHLVLSSCSPSPINAPLYILQCWSSRTYRTHWGVGRGVGGVTSYRPKVLVLHSQLHYIPNICRLILPL